MNDIQPVPTVQSHKIIGVVARTWKIWRVYTQPVAEVEQFFGDTRTIYGVCGRLGLCKKCRKEHNKHGCGKHYVCDRVRGQLESPLIHFEDGQTLSVNEIKALILDNGKVIEMQMKTGDK